MENKDNILSVQPGKKPDQRDTRLKALIDASPDPVVIYDNAGQTTYMNPAFETVYGFSPEQVMGKRIDFVPDDELEKTRDAWERTIKGEKVYLETRRKTKAGKTLHIQLSTAIILDEDQNHLESIVIHRDITPLRMAEKAKENLISKLTTALERVETLSGLVPICANCKKIRDDKGYWNNLERYIEEHSKAMFSHSICPECETLLYGNQKWYSGPTGKKATDDPDQDHPEKNGCGD